MGKISFKGGSITFAGGAISLLSYPQMEKPTIKAQYIYEAGEYRAKLKIKNNSSQTATIWYEFTCSGLSPNYVANDLYRTFTAGQEKVFILDSNTESPNNDGNYEIWAEARAIDPNGLRPDSSYAEITVAAPARKYFYMPGNNLYEILLKDANNSNGSSVTEQEDNLKLMVGYGQTPGPRWAIFGQHILDQTSFFIYRSAYKRIIMSCRYLAGDDQNNFTFSVSSTDTIEVNNQGSMPEDHLITLPITVDSDSTAINIYMYRGYDVSTLNVYYIYLETDSAEVVG